jgi:hypothetical protein
MTVHPPRLRFPSGDGDASERLFFTKPVKVYNEGMIPLAEQLRPKR